MALYIKGRAMTPCQKCGSTERGKPRPSNPLGECKVCARRAQKAWRDANPAAHCAEVMQTQKRHPETRARASAKYYATIPGRAHIYANTRKRQARKLDATPSWADTAGQRKAITALYAQAVESGRQVDHCVPLAGCRGCGAKGEHVIWNLQLLTKSENAEKGNRCPDCWRASQ